MSIRKRNDLNARRDDRVEPGKHVAADDCQRGTLGAIAEVVAPGKHVIVANMMVDLRDQAVEPVGGGRIYLFGSTHQLFRSRVRDPRDSCSGYSG